MSNIKPITINPELFKMEPTKKDKSRHNKTQKLTANNSSISSTKLKRELLKKIQKYKKPENIKSVIPEPSQDFENEFQKSLSFLQQLSKKGNRTLKVDRPTINMNIPDNFDKNVSNGDNLKENNVPYGCLKNGSKPTYRQWKNTTMKNYNNPTIEDKQYNIDVMRDEVKGVISKQTPKQITHDNSNHQSDSKPVIKTNVTTISSNDFSGDQNLVRTHTRSIKYRLGKNNRKISVLIKNASTRKKISSEHNKIRKTTILDMKNYLRRHNLLKAGSEAPNDVIRKLYENCLLSGEINNSNKDNLIHNFLHL